MIVLPRIQIVLLVIVLRRGHWQRAVIVAIAFSRDVSLPCVVLAPPQAPLLHDVVCALVHPMPTVQGPTKNVANPAMVEWYAISSQRLTSDGR